MTPRILPHETEIIGSWLVEGTRTRADKAAARIESLVNSYLVEVGRSDDGWSVLYEDPADNRYWELTYPESASHGGGAPRLVVISGDEAKVRFKA
jgi:hypothetical protein